MLNVMSVAFFVVGAALGYWFLLRPLFRGRPEFKDFYARSDSFWTAAAAKFNTIKTKFIALALMIASVLVEAHDFLMPIAAGIDWTPITASVPAWVWPIASFGTGSLFLWFRMLTAKTHEVELTAVAAGETIAEAKITSGVEPGRV